MNLFIFDWDGCLADTLSIWLQEYVILYKKYGIQTTEEEIIAKSFGKKDGAQNHGVLDYENFNKELVKNIEKSLETVSLNPYAYEILKYLKPKSRLAIVTSSPKHIIFNGLKHNKLVSFFDSVISGDDVAKFKPDPEGIMKLLDIYKIEKEHATMIGDSDNDILAGKNAGIKTMLYRNALNERLYKNHDFTQLNPDYVIRSFEEIEKIF
jgi:pyrophosphatase PpaX